jgi:hypothetical protein
MSGDKWKESTREGIEKKVEDSWRKEQQNQKDYPGYVPGADTPSTPGAPDAGHSDPYRVI